MLEDYLKNNAASLLREYTEKGTLKDSSRRQLVREAVNLLRSLCGNYPKRDEKIALAKSIITLFPSYKIENSETGGIVCII